MAIDREDYEYAAECTAEAQKRNIKLKIMSEVIQGGKRSNAGRKKEEPGKALKYWVKETMAADVDQAIREMLIERFGIVIKKKQVQDEQFVTVINPTVENVTIPNYEAKVIPLPPTTLGQLKAMCPPDLKGLDRALWIRNERVKLGI